MRTGNSIGLLFPDSSRLTALVRRAWSSVSCCRRGRLALGGVLCVLVAAPGLARAVSSDAFCVLPIFDALTGSYPTDKFLIEADRLKLQVGQNREHFKVGFSFIYPGYTSVRRYCQIAHTNNLSLGVILAHQTHAVPASIANIARTDFRNYQWRLDGVTWEGALGGGGDPLFPERDYRVVTPSRYATALRAEYERMARTQAVELVSLINEFPGVIVVVNAVIEEELASGGESSDAYLADYSPFAITEFRDWLRHTGKYDATAGQFAGQGAPASIVGTLVNLGGALRSPFYDDPSPASANGTGQSFNARFGTSFTTWHVRYWDLDQFPAPITDRNFNPAPQSGQGFIPGGFDAPRVRQASSAFWRAWSWDYQDQGNQYPSGNPTQPAFGFRQMMVKSFPNDLLGWVANEGVPPQMLYPHQIPAEQVSASRNRSGATPIWTGLLSLNGQLGITRFGGLNLSQLLQYSSTWGIFEWHPAPYSSPTNPALYTTTLSHLNSYYTNGARCLFPGWWRETGTPGDPIFPLPDSKFAEALRDWLAGKPDVPPPLTTLTNVPPVVSILAPVSGAALAGLAIPLTAYASDYGGVVTNVDFLANGVLIGSAANSPGTRNWTLPWTNAAPGQYRLSARAADGGGNVTTSLPAVVTVSLPASGAWAADTGGHWTFTNRWLAGVIADGGGQTAWFTNDLTADRIVTNDIARAIARLEFGDAATNTAGSWIVEGPATLALAGTPVLTVNALGPGKHVTLSAPLAGTEQVTKLGGGRLILSANNSGHSGGFRIHNTTGSGGGTLRVEHALALGSGALRINGSGGNAPNAALELANTISVANAITLASSRQTDSGPGYPHILNASGNNTLSGPITLAGAGGRGAIIQAGAGWLVLSGNLTHTLASSRTFYFGGDGSITVSGAVRDNGIYPTAVTQQGAGTVILAGDMTYTGPTTVSAGGTVQVGDGATNGMIGAGPIFNHGTLRFFSAAPLPLSAVISGPGEVIQAGSGPLTLNGSNTYSGRTTIVGGPGGPLAVNLVNSSFEAPAIPTWAYQNTSGQNTFNFNATTGFGWTFGTACGLDRSSGTWYPSGAPPPEGSQAAFIQNAVAGSIISQTIDFPVPGVYTIRFACIGRGTTGNGANDIQVRINGATVATVGSLLQSLSVWQTFSATYHCATAGEHTLAFVGTRAGGDYSSCIDRVEIVPPPGGAGGQIVLGNYHALGNGGGLLTVNTNGTLDLAGYSPTVTGVAGGGLITNASASPATLTIKVNDQNASPVIGGPVNVVIAANAGATYQIFNRNNTHSGTTTINGGMLRVNGSLPNGAVTVAGGTLGGTGFIQGAVKVQSGGTLSPGESIGILSLSNTLTLEAGSTTFVEVNAQTLASDRVQGMTTANYGGTLVVSNVAGAFATGKSFQLFDAANHSGNFSSISPATPGPGLAWDFDTSNGTLSVLPAVVIPPTLQFVQGTGNTLVASWSDSGFRLQAQTNALNVGLSTNWADYPAGETSPVVVPIHPSAGSVFLRLIAP
jgi:autotransporter-associated beta strand protein